MTESDSADLKKNMSLPRLAQLRVARFFIRKMCPSSECEDASYLEQAAREFFKTINTHKRKERARTKHMSRLSAKVLDRSLGWRDVNWNVSNIWIATTQNTTRRTCCPSLLSSYCLFIQYNPYRPRIPRSFPAILGSGSQNSWDHKIGISLVQTKISLTTREDLDPDLQLPPSRFVGVRTWTLHNEKEDKEKEELHSLRHERAFECREFVFIDIWEKRISGRVKRYIWDSKSI